MLASMQGNPAVQDMLTTAQRILGYDLAQVCGMTLFCSNVFADCVAGRFVFLVRRSCWTPPCMPNQPSSWQGSIQLFSRLYRAIFLICFGIRLAAVEKLRSTDPAAIEQYASDVLNHRQ
jgi:hypothetical protein